MVAPTPYYKDKKQEPFWRLYWHYYERNWKLSLQYKYRELLGFRGYFTKRFTAELRLKVGGAGSDSTYSFWLRLPFFAIGLRTELIPNWRRKSYEDRVISLNFHHYTLWWTLWLDDSSWRRNDKWYRRFNWCYADWLLGKLTVEKKPLDTYERVPVPMPEETYYATVRMEQLTRRRKRWPFVVDQFTRGEIKVKGGIPHPGKWGDDGTYSISRPCRDVFELVGAFVESVMRHRGIRQQSPV